MKNIKLLAFDIDGTLIPRTRETISENTKKAIRECEKKGIKVTVSLYDAINEKECGTATAVLEETAVLSQSNLLLPSLQDKVLAYHCTSIANQGNKV